MKKMTAFAGLFLVFLFHSHLARPQQLDSSASANTILFASPHPVSGEVPRVVRFSGVVKDWNGKAATGVVGLTCSLYELPEGGSPLWVGTETVELDEQGRYTGLLGATFPDGLPLDLFTSGKTLWLGVQPQLPAGGGTAARAAGRGKACCFLWWCNSRNSIRNAHRRHVSLADGFNRRSWQRTGDSLALR